MTAIKQKHTYSETHEFAVDGEWILRSCMGSAGIKGPDGTDWEASDTELASLRDLLNEYLLWKKYNLPRTVTEGDILNVQPAAKIESSSDEDATGVAF